MPNVFVSVVNYKVEYVLRNANGDIIPSVSVMVYNADTLDEVDLRDGPFTYSNILGSNVFNGGEVKFYIPEGVYDLHFTDISTGETLVLEKKYCGNVKSLKDNPATLYTWQRHVVDGSGILISGLTVTVRKYVDYEETVTVDFYPNGDHGQAVSEYVFDDYIYLDLESGLYEITVSDASGDVIQIFDHVALGYTPPADIMGE